jgi:hypothetical protein
MQSALVMIPVGICWATFVSDPLPSTCEVGGAVSGDAHEETIS